jgi:hypothetical protein
MKFRLSSLLTFVIAVAVLLAGWPVYGAYGLLIASALTFVMLIVRCFSIASRIDRRYFRIAYAFAVLQAVLLLSIGPATRYIIQHDNSRVAVSLYRTVYGPVTDFVAMLPRPVSSISYRYLRQWMPEDVSIDNKWPSTSQFLVSWSRPNGKDRIWMGISRDAK